MSSQAGVPQPMRGWYPDPWGQAALRFWDGVAWTGYLHTPVAQYPVQPYQQQPYQQQPYQQQAYPVQVYEPQPTQVLDLSGLAAGSDQPTQVVPLPVTGPERPAAAANQAPLVWWLAGASVAAVFVVSIALAWILAR